MLKILSVTLAFLLGYQAQANTEKSQYSLFNRTPENQLRPLSTDRPDVTESPYTVDAGWYQIELDFAITRFDNNSRDTSYFFSNLKAGLTSNIDFQLIVDPLNFQNDQWQRNDTQARLKINIFGNDSGDVAMAIVPFVTFADGSNTTRTKLNSGIAIPLSVALPNDWSLGLMSQWSWNYDETNESYRTEYLSSAALSRPITDTISGFIEYANFSNQSPTEDTTSQLGLGLTIAIGNHGQLDLGSFFGLTNESIDRAPFIGYSHRF